MHNGDTTGSDKLGNYTATVQQLLAGETRITTVTKNYKAIGAVTFQVVSDGFVNFCLSL